MGMKSAGGEIVQVQGGHIVRSTGRKDRHSKVYTAKGPRDRRVRLSAHTAIQFYDVQDRLGYDRPSKAVDWLIKKAKAAIDKLAELPPWHPTLNTTDPAQETHEQNNPGSNEMTINAEHNSESSGYNFQLQRQLGEEQENHHSAFIPSPIDTDAITFFPTTTTSSAASTINFQSCYPHDMISRTNINSTREDLGLSLHSFQDPAGLIHGQTQEGGTDQTPSNGHTLFAGSTTPSGFDANYQRIVAWNNDAGFMVNNSSAFLGQGGSAYNSHQRGTLQSSFSPSLRPWNDIPMAASSSEHHLKAQQMHQAASIFGSRFLSDGLPGFCIPARIQGEDERPSSSASPNSHH